jgi:hypothetical protein
MMKCGTKYVPYFSLAGVTVPALPATTANFNALGSMSGTLGASLASGFSRASVGYYYNSAGVLTSAAINTPRIDYNPATLSCNGLLMEAQSTNAFLYSTNMLSAPWSMQAATCALSSILSPDNASYMYLLQSTAKWAYILQQIIVTPGTTWTASAYVQAGTSTSVTIFDNNNQLNYGTFTLVGAGTATANGTGTTSTIQFISNGIYRITITWTINAGHTGSSAGFWSGSFTNAQNNGSFYISQPQYENLSFATSYIPTAGSTVTRASDVLSTSSLTWFNSSAGTLEVEWVPQAISFGSSQCAMQLSGPSGTNGYQLYCSTSNISALAVNASTTEFTANIGTLSPGNLQRALLSYSTAPSFSATLDAAVPTTQASGAVANTPTLLNLGCNSVGGAQISGWLQKFNYWNYVLSTSQQEQAT